MGTAESIQFQQPPYRRRVQHRPAKMRTYDDTFSATKIYPGKGKLYVRGDSKIFRFQNGKTESLFLQRKNPRRIAWTMLYRRMHKKGISEVSRTGTRRCLEISKEQEDFGVGTNVERGALFGLTLRFFKIM